MDLIEDSDIAVYEWTASATRADHLDVEKLGVSLSEKCTPNSMTPRQQFIYQLLTAYHNHLERAMSTHDFADLVLRAIPQLDERYGATTVNNMCPTALATGYYFFRRGGEIDSAQKNVYLAEALMYMRMFQHL